MGNLDASELQPEHTPRLNETNTPGLDILLVLARDRWRIATITFAALLLGACFAFLLKSTFTATATILPPQAPQSSASALMGQLGSLASLGGGAGSLLKNPADMYVGILESRTIADHVIDQFHLQSFWKLKKREDVRKKLKSRAQFEAAKNGLIEINIKDPDPKLASDLANAFVDQLYRVNSTLAITEAGQRRLFFDQQLAEEKNALIVAENDLRSTQEKTGLIQLSGQASMAIRNIAEIQAEIADREVRMQAMRTFATDQNPELIRLHREIDTLREQLTKLQNDNQNMPLGDTQVPAGRVPAVGLEYVRKAREVKYHETLFDLLSRQYEAARIDEAKSAPIIQVVDRAVPPDKKSGPPRMLLTLGIGVIGFLGACLWSFLNGAILRMRQVPESAAKLDRLGDMLHIRLG
jgi:tyrosine-protein kinase Etk/Wzc